MSLKYKSIFGQFAKCEQQQPERKKEREKQLSCPRARQGLGWGGREMGDICDSTTWLCCNKSLWTGARKTAQSARAYALYAGVQSLAPKVLLSNNPGVASQKYRIDSKTKNSNK